jgi:hypothetical protein
VFYCSALALMVEKARLGEDQSPGRLSRVFNVSLTLNLTRTASAGANPIGSIIEQG